MRKIGRVLVLIIGIVLIVISLWNIGDTLMEYKRSRDEYDKLREEIFSALGNEDSDEETLDDSNRENSVESAGGENEESTSESLSDEDEAKKLTEQYAKEVEQARAQARKECASVCNAVAQLQSQNEDVVGWIKFLNMDISYPVMHGDTNDDYLYHTWSGMENKSGSIFMEALNTGDFQDSHTLIYGHNMKDGSMFGKLKNYREEYGYDKSPYFVIYTADAAYEYHIFAYYDIAEDGDIYCVHYEPSEEFGQLVQSMKKHAWRDTGVRVSKDDKVITLSTCSTEGRRFVLNAVRTDEYPVK